MNRKSIRKLSKNGDNKTCKRSYVISPFLDNKVLDLLTADRKKKEIGKSEFNGKLNQFIIFLIRNELKSRNLL